MGQMPNYNISPVGYWKRFRRDIEIHNATQDRSYLFYAALELRYTIEAILFYYLSLVGDRTLPKSVRKLYNAKNLKLAIIQYDPLFLYKLDFVEMCHFYRRELQGFVKPDIDLLSDVYGDLGNYLHAQKKLVRSSLDKDRTFWSQFAKVLDSCNEHVPRILSAPFVTMKFTPLGDSLIEQYSKGQLSKAMLKKTLVKKWNLLFKGITEQIHDF